VVCTYIHTYILLTLYPRRDSRGISDIAPRHPRFTKISELADVIGGKPIAVLLQSTSGVSAINPLVATNECRDRRITTFMEERERCYSFMLYCGMYVCKSKVNLHLVLA
jgi:hypothetical protein